MLPDFLATSWLPWKQQSRYSWMMVHEINPLNLSSHTALLRSRRYPVCVNQQAPHSSLVQSNPTLAELRIKLVMPFKILALWAPYSALSPPQRFSTQWQCRKLSGEAYEYALDHFT